MVSTNVDAARRVDVGRQPRRGDDEHAAVPARLRRRGQAGQHHQPDARRPHRHGGAMVTRITQRAVTQTSLQGLYGNLRAVNKLQQQLSSGKVISMPSDDPTGTNKALLTRQALSGNAQQTRNITDGRRSSPPRTRRCRPWSPGRRRSVTSRSRRSTAVPWTPPRSRTSPRRSPACGRPSSARPTQSPRDGRCSAASPRQHGLRHERYVRGCRGRDGSRPPPSTGGFRHRGHPRGHHRAGGLRLARRRQGPVRRHGEHRRDVGDTTKLRGDLADLDEVIDEDEARWPTSAPGRRAWRPRRTSTARSS